MKKKNQGFTLVELVIVVAIFSILLGIMTPSLNSILGFRVQRAANSIGVSLDKTKIEAMNRLVGEMKLEKRSDGYYISYYLDRGKAYGGKQEQPEKIAPAKTKISYTTCSDASGSDPVNHEMQAGDSVILTYDRITGAFLPVQNKGWTQTDINAALEAGEDIDLVRDGEGDYCSSITVEGGYRKRVLTLNIYTGTYDIHA